MSDSVQPEFSEPYALTIPDQLKEMIREIASQHDSDISEKAGSNSWTVTSKRIEWSGYHDEDNLVALEITVSDRKPPENLLINNHPVRREEWQKRLAGFRMDEYFEANNHVCIRLECKTPPASPAAKPLWITIFEFSERL